MGLCGHSYPITWFFLSQIPSGERFGGRGRVMAWHCATVGPFLSCQDPDCPGARLVSLSGAVWACPRSVRRVGVSPTLGLAHSPPPAVTLLFLLCQLPCHPHLQYDMQDDILLHPFWYEDPLSSLKKEKEKTHLRTQNQLKPSCHLNLLGLKYSCQVVV